MAQDLSSFALDRSTGRTEPRLDGPAVGGNRPIVDLVAAVARGSAGPGCSISTRRRSTTRLVEAILATGVPYFDLSLQHVSRPLLKRMRRWGEGERFLDRIASIRAAEPTAAFRSSFIIGYPGETEADHDRLLEWIDEAQLDWVGFFPFSHEVGTYAAGLDGQVPAELVAERLRECTELQDAITAARREALIGIDGRGAGRRPGRGTDLPGGTRDRRDRDPARPICRSGSFVEVVVTGADGPDLVAELRSEPMADPPVGRGPPSSRRGRGRSDERRRPQHRYPGRRATSGGSVARTTTFGPSALLTPANAITVLRLLATPVVIVLIMLWGASWFTFVFGGLLALSDGIDGWLARKQGTTRSGAFLDPLADKVVVLGALVALVAKGIVWWLPVAIIAIREVAMSVYRSVVGRHGVSIPARNSAKVKTLLQDVAIGLCLAPPLAGHHALLSVAIWVATAHDRVHRRPVLPRRPAGRPPAPRRSRRRRRPGERHELGGLSGHAHRDRGGGHRAAARARSPTPTRSGWGSTWPPPGSPPTSTRRWGTTTSASSWPSGPPWPGATGSSSAGASARPRTTSPARPSPR